MIVCLTWCLLTCLLYLSQFIACVCVLFLPSLLLRVFSYFNRSLCFCVIFWTCLPLTLICLLPVSDCSFNFAQKEHAQPTASALGSKCPDTHNSFSAFHCKCILVPNINYCLTDYSSVSPSSLKILTPMCSVRTNIVEETYIGRYGSVLGG